MSEAEAADGIDVMLMWWRWKLVKKYKETLHRFEIRGRYITPNILMYFTGEEHVQNGPDGSIGHIGDRLDDIASNVVDDNVPDLHNPGRNIHNLIQRCDALVKELEDFSTYIRQHKWKRTIEISHYRALVKSEQRNLGRLADRQNLANSEVNSVNRKNGKENGREEDVDEGQDNDISNEKAYQIAQSSNLPFLEAVWNAAKSTHGLVAIQKRFYYGGATENDAKQTSKAFQSSKTKKGKSGKALVDVVAREGLEWIKISLVTNNRLLMDKAREGWAESSSDEEGYDSDRVGGSNSDDEDPDGAIPLIKMAEDILKAAKEVRIKSQQPTVKFILPRIIIGKDVEVDKLINRLRDKGVIIDCSATCLQARPLANILDNLLPSPIKDFTSTVNIDCTILLALVSDFSHYDVTSEPWFHNALNKQIELEDEQNLLANMLYPALVGRKLVATAEAVKRMQEIVDTIGTPDEKKRTALFVNQTTSTSGDMESDSQDRRNNLATLSKLDVPADLFLPILTVPDENVEDIMLRLPAAARQVKGILLPINQSVFFHGWMENITTITSNKTVVRKIEAVLNQYADTEREWPKLWLCPTARSLVGKEKARRL